MRVICAKKHNGRPTYVEDFQSRIPVLSPSIAVGAPVILRCFVIPHIQTVPAVGRCKGSVAGVTLSNNAYTASPMITRVRLTELPTIICYIC